MLLLLFFATLIVHLFGVLDFVFVAGFPNFAIHENHPICNGGEYLQSSLEDQQKGDQEADVLLVLLHSRV